MPSLSPSVRKKMILKKIQYAIKMMSFYSFTILTNNIYKVIKNQRCHPSIAFTYVFFNYCFFANFHWVYLPYNVTLVSYVQQNEFYIYTYILPFKNLFTIYVTTKHWVEFPVIYIHRPSLVIYFIHTTVYVYFILPIHPRFNLKNTVTTWK